MFMGSGRDDRPIPHEHGMAGSAGLATPCLAADKNGDTALDKSEFPAFIDAAAAAGKPMAQKIKAASRYNMAFGRIDKNGDGFISPEELSSLK